VVVHTASLALIVIGLASIFAQHGLLYNIDFKGGTQTEVRWDGMPPIGNIRDAVSSKLRGVTVVAAHGAGGTNEVFISTGLSSQENVTEVRRTIEDALSSITTRHSILDFEVIGPQVSS
jgi:preprotein translocase subunit SecF